MNSSGPSVRTIGDNPTRLWGLTAAERNRRIARAARLPDMPADPADPVMLISSDYAFDPQWLRFMRDRPGSVLTIDGATVMAHTNDPAATAATERGDTPDLPIVRVEDHAVFYNEQLRKREQPFLERLTPATVRGIERQSYYGAYKGVTDLLTKYLWPEAALVLTRLAARLGISPNMVTTVGAILCIWATLLFWEGHYWIGMAIGLIFMVLDTVDGKLARCTITSSAWGNIFDHGIDLVHPLFWWWAWAHGLGAWHLALSHDDFVAVMAAMVAGYVVQRLIEGIFMRRFGMHIHVWQRFDSRFRLITARRNPNMVILFFATLAGRPDLGIILVAWWTILSCGIHGVRLAQAELVHRRGARVASWLQEAA